MTYKVGDKVRSRCKFYGCKRRGVITRIDGAYIYVRMNYRGILFQLYANELEQY